MLHNFRKAYRGHRGAYVQILALLLIVSALVLVVMSMSGCDGCTNHSNHSSSITSVQKASNATFQCKIKGRYATASPGGQAKRRLGGLVIGSPAPDSVDLHWSPPPGSTNFDWDFPPDNPGGPPPYVWSGLGPYVAVDVTFNMPEMPDLETGESVDVVENLVSTHSDGSASAAQMSTSVIKFNRADALPGQTKPLPQGQAPAKQPAAPDADVDVWQTKLWLDVKGITLTTTFCQDWLDFLQGDEAFLAARMPMPIPLVPTHSYTIPIAYRGDTTPVLELINYDSFGVVITLPLELRPERATFLANELPSAPGERWVALGLDPAPASCPSGLELGSGNWGLRGTAWLDMNDLPNNCEGCTVQVYYCYEGQEQPMMPAALQRIAAGAASRALGSGAGLQTYQGEGITCIGPQPLPLKPGLELTTVGTAHITPTRPISFHHLLITQGTAEIDLTMGSNLAADWGLYEGDVQGPYVPLQPITPPLTVYGFAEFWAVGEVPSDTQDGPYSLFITATLVSSPSVSAWTSDFMWSGGWVAPPVAPDAAYHVYLPLVTKGD